jgi:hypothetical protein
MRLWCLSQVNFRSVASDANTIVGLIPSFARVANLTFYDDMAFGVLLTFRGTIGAVVDGTLVGDAGL